MIINLTQHNVSPEQAAAGVCELTPGAKALAKRTLTFESIPTRADIRARSRMLADIAEVHAAPPGEGRAAMIGGAPFLMAELEEALREKGIQPLYAFSERESVEEAQEDGSVRKVNVFRHLGFVTA